MSGGWWRWLMATHKRQCRWRAKLIAARNRQLHMGFLDISLWNNSQNLIPLQQHKWIPNMLLGAMKWESHSLNEISNRASYFRTQKSTWASNSICAFIVDKNWIRMAHDSHVSSRLPAHLHNLSKFVGHYRGLHLKLRSCLIYLGLKTQPMSATETFFLSKSLFSLGLRLYWTVWASVPGLYGFHWPKKKKSTGLKETTEMSEMEYQEEWFASDRHMIITHILSYNKRFRWWMLYISISEWINESFKLCFLNRSSHRSKLTFRSSDHWVNCWIG